ncbi:TonB-dependent receptor [Arenibacter sp. GZD96]|uniref:SusC/RagA family TonB-linked outer membrane protein n=1 Tax=Aurantibrevibacter litoralis TaxID=3106030 RepID=UPI002AFDF077|nr:TonB-dependent receptor [Arenibacter sp. GZD-96]MEA1784770.1 TonB-dependent receptor [Arenibacter sp. GZD-96]
MNLKLLLCALSMGFFAMSFAQTEVTGTVTDDYGAPLPGANVVIVGTSTGVVTDFDGNFRIAATQGDVLEISYLGTKTQRVTIGNSTTIQVVMESDAAQLDDVVVVGYGTQRKSDVTGAIASLKSEDFNKGVVTNPGELLQGKLAGVNVTASSGEPGAAQNFIIRGIGSLRSGTQPLFVVDGFLLSNSSTGVDTNPLNFINPNDIESIDVLKDASATAVYGSRASNGVVVITTKRGRSGKAEMNFSVSAAFSTLANKLDVFSADEFRTQVLAVGGTLEDLGGNTDWQDELSQTGFSENYNFSMSGAASDKFSYFASIGVQDQEGILKNSNLKRYSGKLNMNQKGLNGRLNIDYNLTASHTENLRPSITSIISDMLSLNPTVPTFTDGEPTLLPTNALNPIKRNELFSDLSVNNRILINIAPSFEILDGLTYRLNLGVDYSDTNRDQQFKPFPAVTNESNVSDGVLDSANSTNTNELIENTLTYNWSNDMHNVTLLAGHSYQKFEDITRIFSARGFANNNIEPKFQDQTSSTQFPTTLTSSAVRNELQSFFGRANYSYNNRYLFTATLRADGSSKFGEDNRYGYFPSFALGWNVSNEDFMENSVFNNLKFRASWGQTGNEEIPSKITKASFSEDRLITGSQSLNTYPIDTNGSSIEEFPFGVVFTRLANPDLKWEVSTQLDFGIDFALFDYRLTGTLDYFNKKSTDILLEVVPADPVQPTATFWTNIENMEIHNNGIELSLDYNSNPKQDFSYNIGGNVTYIKNEVRDSPFSVLTTGAAQGSGQTGATINGFINDEPIGAFYMQRFEGIGPDGLNVFTDSNGDGEILDDDRRVVGSAIPKFIYAFYLNFKYKAFDLGLNFNGVSGNKIFNHTTMTLFNKPQLARSNNTTDFAVQFPEEAGTNANTVSTRFLENGSFLRLNNATLAYSLSSEKIGLGDIFQNIRLSLTGQNLFVITDYSGFDPEVNTGSSLAGIQTFGIDRFTFPRARTVLFGLNFTF